MEAIVSTNEINNYSVSELNYLRESIENMNKFNQVEVLRIFYKHKDVTLNKNKYGIHINLSQIKKELLDELAVYIKYVNAQESNLNVVEQQKEDYRNTYFSKDIKDISKHNIIDD
jgi:NTP pyrophosphatase (non-canonical NTP hydrolase)